MSSDFWASYASGIVSISIGNRLDILKTELQAGNRHFTSSSQLTAHHHTKPSQPLTLTANLLRGTAAPLLGYGALNSLLFTTYNHTLQRLDPSIFDPSKLAGVSLSNIWAAGATAGLACWAISAPVELIKCRAQLMVDGHRTSWATARHVWTHSGKGIRGFYLGGTITSVRDSLGYAWYFWSYELVKRLRLSSRQPDPFADPNATDVLVAGGVAGVVTWASIYPLDVVKTKIQTQSLQVAAGHAYSLPVAGGFLSKSSWSVAKDIARTEGLTGFYRGLTICSFRAFVVNAVQFYVYETVLKLFKAPMKEDG